MEERKERTKGKAHGCMAISQVLPIFKNLTCRPWASWFFGGGEEEEEG